MFLLDALASFVMDNDEEEEVDADNTFVMPTAASVAFFRDEDI